MQGGYESGTEGLGELSGEEWLVSEDDSSQFIQCPTELCFEA